MRPPRHLDNNNNNNNNSNNAERLGRCMVAAAPLRLRWCRTPGACSRMWRRRCVAMVGLSHRTCSHCLPCVPCCAKMAHPMLLCVELMFEWCGMCVCLRVCDPIDGSYKDANCQFMWTIDDRAMHYAQIPKTAYFNHFEGNRCITTKVCVCACVRPCTHVRMRAFVSVCVSVCCACEYVFL